MPRMPPRAYDDDDDDDEADTSSVEAIEAAPTALAKKKLTIDFNEEETPAATL